MVQVELSRTVINELKQAVFGCSLKTPSNEIMFFTLFTCSCGISLMLQDKSGEK